MTGAITFSVTGTPRPQQRTRFVRGRVVSFTDPKLRVWRQALERACREVVQLRGGARPIYPAGLALECEMLFYFATDKVERHGRSHTHKPDKDNLAKAVLDVMETAGIYHNDSQVARGPVIKRWGETGGVFVTVRPVMEDVTVASAPALLAPDWLMG